jgi:hypothetical protein
MQPGADPATRPRLVVPEGLVIDDSARTRLERRLALAPETVAGIGAAASELAPGASYRVHAEWTALDTPESATLASGGSSLRGAVLVRPGVGFTVNAGEVALATGVLAVDPGAHTHDPHRTLGALQTATERGRPPFPRRPLVVFLGVETPAGDWLVRFVNRLVRRDVEARIAAPAVAPGLHLTRPCAPEEASIRALAPDVVVTMDAAAAAHVDDWCAGDRATVVVAWDPDLPDPMELVSWQIGRASGRLRARIGPRVESPAFASLVGRLCAGPQPMPPVDRDGPFVRPVVREQWTSRTADDDRTHCMILTGAVDEAGSARAAGLADSFAAAGLRVLVAPIDVAGETAREASLVVVVGAPSTTGVDALVAARRAAGRPTVFDVGADAVAYDDGRPHLTEAAHALAELCGAATATGGARHLAAREAVARTLLLPTALTRARVIALREAREHATPGTPLVVGWRIDPAARPDYVEAVAVGIAAYLVEPGHREDVRVEVVAAEADVPASLLSHSRVTLVERGALDPMAIASWSLHVWTPRLAGAALLDDTRVLEEASCAGVASVFPADAMTGVDGVVSSHVLVESADDAAGWLAALHHVLDDDHVRARRSREAARRADALDGLAVARAMVTRLRGWASYSAPGGPGPEVSVA